MASERHLLLINEASSGQLDSIQSLLADAADPNASDGTGRTPLHAAARRGYALAVSVLLGAGADKDTINDEGESPLMWAAIEGQLAAVETLLGAGADTNVRAISDRYTALHLAANGGQAAIVSALLGAGAEKDALEIGGSSPLMWAARRGHLAVVETLLRAGADASFRSSVHPGATALHLAAKTGRRTAVVSALLGAGVEKNAVDDYGESPLMWAARGGDSDVVETLLGAGVDSSIRSSSDGCTALHIAARSGGADKVSVLLCAGAEVNALDDNGSSPLTWAIGGGYSDIVETLLGAGADSNIRSGAHGTTPSILLAAARGTSGVSMLAPLLQHGAAVDAQDANGHRCTWLAPDKTRELRRP